MTVQNLTQKLNLEIICQGAGLDNEINGCYATDLLSLAMANVDKDKNKICSKPNRKNACR